MYLSLGMVRIRTRSSGTSVEALFAAFAWPRERVEIHGSRDTLLADFMDALDILHILQPTTPYRKGRGEINLASHPSPVSHGLVNG